MALAEAPLLAATAATCFADVFVRNGCGIFASAGKSVPAACGEAASHCVPKDGHHVRSAINKCQEKKMGATIQIKEREKRYLQTG